MMYAVKVENGMEKIRARRYAAGTAPLYTSAAEESMGKKMLVVPGYIFTSTKMIGANYMLNHNMSPFKKYNNSFELTYSYT